MTCLTYGCFSKVTLTYSAILSASIVNDTSVSSLLLKNSLVKLIPKMRNKIPCTAQFRVCTDSLTVHRKNKIICLYLKPSREHDNGSQITLLHFTSGIIVCKAKIRYLLSIMLTCPCYLDPLTPHFYIVWVYLIFLFLL